MTKIYIAADHTGFALKQSLAAYAKDILLLEVEDVGANEFNATDDYPDYIIPCAQKVRDDTRSIGVLIGGSGQGEAMAANRIPGIRATVFYGKASPAEPLEAEGTEGVVDGYDSIRISRMHNDANVLSLGARFISFEEAKEALRIFIETKFSAGERHVRRLAKF